MGGVLELEGGGEDAFVTVRLSTYATHNLRVAEARKLAARIYVAARAAERIKATEGPEERTR